MLVTKRCYDYVTSSITIHFLSLSLSFTKLILLYVLSHCELQVALLDVGGRGGASQNKNIDTERY